MLQNPQLHYLDNAATTIVAPEVADVIDKAMREHWANPSSLYGPGARSEEALNAARAAVARTLGCKSRELYFTSCGSESNNLALLGAARTRTFGKDIVVSGFEHPSVQRPLEDLAKQLNLDPAVLKDNVDRYNAAVEAGKDEEFGRTSFANKLDEGPYYAIKVAPGVHHTMGGLKINTNTEVLDASGNVIPGLYAAGEVTGGIHGANRLGSCSIPDTVTFGRIAARSALAMK